ncbi:MAG TPA: polysaccharide pyruvyl transferase family protein [Solirubrobacterales bacterium]|jgi:hypothetical protein
MSPAHLFATPETAAEVAAARAVVVLIGGYDGSGNYGDLLQLDAALELLHRFEPEVVLLPVLERTRLADHDPAAFVRAPARVAFFDADAQETSDGLVPLPAPTALSFAAHYLYGGGYLNLAWGERKLAMLQAAEALTAAAESRTCRLATGIQAGADWVAGATSADRERLRAFELLGGRDLVSVTALREVGAEGAVTDTGDDAVGALRRTTATAPPPESGDVLRVNFHIAEHPWVSDRPEAIADLYADLAAELGRQAGLAVAAQPFVAYHDRYVDETAGLERLRAACAARGISVEEPRLLQPIGAGDAVESMRRATVTLSCSYHVALTALLAGVPTVLLRDTAYYDQKAAGLAAAFELPPAFALSSSADAGAAARELAPLLLGDSSALRAHLALRAGRVRERRADVEVEVLSRLGGAAAAALGGELGAATERLRERSAEPAALLAELATLRSAQETAAPPRNVYFESATADAGSTDAEQQLATLLGSRSWRITEPLRRFGARLRRSR